MKIAAHDSYGFYFSHAKGLNEIPVRSSSNGDIVDDRSDNGRPKSPLILKFRSSLFLHIFETGEDSLQV